MRLFPLLCGLLLFLIAGTAGAGQKSVTFFLDGAQIESDAPAVKGYLEYPLPESVVPDSLRVKPVGPGSVSRVEVAAGEPDRRRAKEIAGLEQQRKALKDKLQDLSTREEIYRAAAKTQSGKAPRKSKANPDPLASLQQGTEFALGRLEAVNRSQRKCQQALDEVERKLATARKTTPVARIWLSAGKARISYQVSNERWVPCYDFRWSGDRKGELLLHARLPRAEKGVTYLVSNGTLAQGASPTTVTGTFPTISRHPLTLRDTAGSDRPPAFAFQPLDAGLPPGEAAIYWRGEYLGNGRFAGGDATQVSLGGK